MVENPSLQISTVKLDGPRTYHQWSRSIKFFLRSHGLEGHITGAKHQPSSNSAGYTQWVTENSQIVIWLLHSMTPDISYPISFCDTAKEMWDTVAQTYSQRGDIAQAYELQYRFQELRQGEMIVTAFVAELRHLWIEIDSLCTFSPTNAHDIAAFQ
ncbi:hypothetical protein AXF42_Ash020601 [Apostasia shenzhenica]|uniref:Retrotransposon Copia-like N-terminal domain-containing protein n=1 Tax=Apostasia shenzhenica TaxID=1088818 RepID=A0A2I0A0F4_9ASPA|nr:hypothetical protein AXF42_Ash020601 [Apostasia shenzhenica]